MATYKLVTDNKNKYFTNNKITIGTAAPTSGTHAAGDIVLSSSANSTAFGWICTAAGTPGTWKVLKSGADVTSVSGNAGTATKLATARTLTVGDKGKTFDGSGNVSWTLDEIGAASSSHTHTSMQEENLSGLTVSLNDYTLSDGKTHIKYYYCPTDGGGSNITGRPDDSNLKAFNLKVELIRWASTTDYITKQTYTRGNEGVSWERFCTSGTWSSWKKMLTLIVL